MPAPTTMTSACTAGDSTPGERRVAHRVQLAGAVTREPERLEQCLPLAEQLLGHERAYADHLVAMVGVGDYVRVLAEGVEDREAVGRERADSAGWLRAV